MIEQHTYHILLRHEDDTVTLGAKFAEKVTAPCTIFFYGELGAGKTTFVRGFLRALSVSGRVKSPTYTLVEPYHLVDGRQIFHFDFYRIQSNTELLHLGLEEYFHANAICLVEWPLKAAGFLPDPDIECHLEYRGDQRQCRIVAQSERGKMLCSAFTR